MRKRWWRLVPSLWVALLVLVPAGATAQAGAKESKPIRVVMDDNYPPYVFRTETGTLQGILIDQWSAWERVTGRKVEIHAMDWGDALRRMREGEFDVIDTIFDTRERREYLDFTGPYASIEVPIYFRKEISGIANLESLQGFTVAAKAGDHAVSLLEAGGNVNVRIFRNYESIVEAAKGNRVNVFVIDAPPANFYLNKLGIEDEFRRSQPINVGAFHRAVRKGNTVLLNSIMEGFVAIGPAELAMIEEKWLGRELKSGRYLIYAGYLALGTLLLLAVVLGWNFALRRQVRRRTSALQASEGRFRRIMEADMLGMIFWDSAGNITDANDVFLRMVGFTRKDLTNGTMRWNEMTPAEYRELDERALEEVLKTGACEPFEKEYFHKSGTRVPILIGGASLPEEPGHGVAFVVDLTERRQAEADQRRSEETLRLFVEYSPVGVAMFDREMRYMAVSRRFLADLGIENTDVIGRSHYDLFPEIPERWKAVHRRCLAGAIESAEDDPFPRKDGTTDWIRWSIRPWKEADGSIGGIVLFTEVINERKQAEDAIRRYGTIFKQAAWGMAVADPATDALTQVNPAFARMHGYSTDEMLGMDLAETFAPESRRDLPVHAKAVNEKGHHTYESVHIRKDGTRFPCLTDVTAFKGADGRVEFRAAIVEDLTERRRTEAAMLESELHKGAILEAALDCIITIDHEGMVVDFNPAAERTFGYPRNTVLGRELAELIIPEHFRERHRQGMAHFLATGEGPVLGKRIEVPAMRADGSEFPAELAISVIKGQERPMFTAYLRDITERRQAEKALRESETRFRELAENIQEVFWMSEPATGRVLYVSPGFEKIWGLPCASLYESRNAWVASLHPDDRDHVEAAAKSRQPEGTYDEVYRILRPDGAVRWVHDRAFPVRSDDGEILRIVGTAQDVTDQRTLEDQFRQSQKMEAVGQLSSGVAHDFNNILTAIQMNASMLGALEELPRDAAEFVSDIETAVERAAGLTRQLLAFGRKQVMHKTEIDVNAVVRGMARMLVRVLGENVKLDIDLSESSLFADADRGMLEQILLNLSINARDAMPDGGLLRIATSVIRAKTQTQGERATGGRVEFIRISVRDNGTGMSPEIKAHIFEPFFTTKGVGGGSGLGLAAVHGIVRQHEGFIEVESEPGSGTEFRVHIPYLRDQVGAPDSQESPPPKQSASTGGETILVVEDEAPVRFLVRAILRRAGYSVLDAENGVAALELWRNNREKVQLLMTDIVMPDSMNGVELALLIHREDPLLPVLFTSGYAPDAVREGIAMEEGVNFLPKPFDVERMLGMVRSTLDRARR